MRGLTRPNRFRIGASALLLALTSGMPAPRAQTPVAGPADTLRLSVDGAVDLALSRGVEAALARQNVLTAEAFVGEAYSYGLPQIDLGATYTRNLLKPVIFIEFEPGNTQAIEIGEDHAYSAGVTLRQVLWASGRVRSGIRMATDRAAAAGLAGDDAAAAIARDVKAAYYLALLAAQQTDIARRSLEQAERSVQQITARVQRGVAPEFDRLRAEVTAANRRALLTRAQAGDKTTRESLKRLIGVELGAPVTLTDSLDYSEYTDSQDESVNRALESRRDLAAARKEVEASEHQLRAQANNDLPTLFLDGGVAWQGQTSKDLFPDDNESAESATVGLTFAWPLFDGFRNRSKTRQAEAALARARLAARQLEDVVRLQVRSNWNDVRSIAEEIVGLRQAVDLANEAYRIAQVRYEQGLSTVVELLDAELALFSAQIVLSEGLFRYNVALAELEYGTGEGPKLTRP